MKRLEQQGRVLRWLGFFAAMMMLVVWVVSVITRADYCCNTWRAASGAGGVGICWRQNPWPGFRGLHIRYEPDYRLLWLPGYVHRATMAAVSVPLWMLFLLVVLPTAYLFWSNRRHLPPGHCQRCGYNLTGNVSGTCPECGSAVPGQRAEPGGAG